MRTRILLLALAAGAAVAQTSSQPAAPTPGSVSTGSETANPNRVPTTNPGPHTDLTSPNAVPTPAPTVPAPPEESYGAESPEQRFNLGWLGLLGLAGLLGLRRPRPYEEPRSIDNTGPRGVR